MKKRSSFIAVASLTLVGFLLAACGAAAASIEPQTKDGFVSGAPERGGLEEQPAFSEAVDDVSSTNSASSERLVIKNASLSIVVDDPEKKLNEISALAEQMGGFVVSSYLYQSTLSNGIEVPTANITIRVPAKSLQDAINHIEADARDVLTNNISGQDVTAEYTDLQSRLRNLQDAEVLLRQIMNDATKTEDILNAFNQLNSITEQIEVLKGQIKYYEESAAMSAISVELIPSQSVQPITIGGWEPVGVAKDAIQALVNALQAIVNALIWLALYVLPILAIMVLPLWLIVRGLRRWTNKSKASTARKK